MTKNLVEGWYTVKPIDKERYQERDGLEGPFQTKAGKVVYYDPREGSYYDPDTDMYLSYDEWRELNESCVYTVEYTSQSGKRVPMSHKTFEIFSEAVAFGKAGVAGGSYRSFEVYEQAAQVNEGLRAGVDFDLASKEYKGYVLGGEDDSDEDRRATLWGVYKALGDGTYQQVSSVKDPKSNGKYSVSAYSSGVPYEQFKWTVDNFAVKEEAEGEATHWEVSYDYGPHQSNTLSVKAKSKEEALDKAKQVAKDVHKHNRITSISISPKKNESLSEAKSYVGRETKDGTWRVFKTGNAVAVAGPFKSAQEAQAWIKKQSMQEKVDESNINEAYINTNKDAISVLGNLRKISKSIELGQSSYEGNLAGEYANDVWEVYNFIEAKTKGFQNIDNNAKDAIKAMMELRKVAKGMEREPGSSSNAQFANQIVNTLYPVMQYLDSIKEESAMNEDISQDAHHMQQDHEVQMARSDLYKTANYAIKLHSLLKGVSEAEGIEGWMQAKITKAADYLGSVFHALEYDMIEKSAPAMPTMESTQPVTEAMRLDRDNVIHADADAQQFAKHYRAGMAGDYRAGGPTDKDTANSEKFHTIYSSEDTRSGFAGSGTTVYTNRKTGEQFEVERNPSGKGFYGTDHYIRVVSNLDEAVAKIACVKCDEVSTAAAWKKNNGFCPKCKTSSQGVAESSDYAKKRKAADDEYYGKKKPTPAAKTVTKTDYQKRRETNEAEEDTYMKQWYDYSEDYAMLELYVDGKLVDQWNDYFHSNETGNPLQKKFIDMAKKNGVDPIGLKVIDGEDGNEGVFTSSGLRWNSTETTAGGIAAVVMPLGKIQKRKK